MNQYSLKLLQYFLFNFLFRRLTFGYSESPKIFLILLIFGQKLEWRYAVRDKTDGIKL